MRIVVVTAALLLVAGCAQSGDGQAEQTRPLTPVPSKSGPASPPAPSTAPRTTPTSPVAATAPAAGAPIAGVIGWVQAGAPAQADGFHTATRDGVATTLGQDVAFVTPDGKSKCMTDGKYGDGALACLVGLDAPPPRPAGTEGEWVGGWVDFNGTGLQVGSLHGDPGRFTAGSGPKLNYGQSLKFGDFQCRSDPAGLYCVDFAHQSAVRLSAAGVEPFGCLHEVDPPENVGAKFSC